MKGILDDFLNNINLENDQFWMVIDNRIHEAAKSQVISDLFTKGSHHRNISVILSVQNFFTKGNAMRNITLNSHCIGPSSSWALPLKIYNQVRLFYLIINLKSKKTFIMS